LVVYPRKYSSKGTFTFEGLDIVNYLGDSTTISIADTLLNKINVTSEIEEYSTLLNSTFTLGGTYHLNHRWTFNALYLLRNDFGFKRHSLSASTMLKFPVFDLKKQLFFSWVVWQTKAWTCIGLSIHRKYSWNYPSI